MENDQNTNNKPKYTSLQRFKIVQNVDRRFLWQYVARKLKRKIKVVHISSVVNILLDEIISELMTIGSFKIGNFGLMMIKQMPNRRHFHFAKKMIVESAGRKILRFKLNKKVHKIITQNLDIAKTFGEANDG